MSEKKLTCLLLSLLVMLISNESVGSLAFLSYCFGSLVFFNVLFSGS